MKNVFKIITKLVLIVLLFASSISFGQSIWTNPITGTNPNTANPYTTGQTVNGNITVSGIGRGTGIAGTSANDRYNATGWNSTSLDANDYFSFTLTPNSGCEIDFTSFVYTAQASGTGPVSFALRSSVDGFVANIGTATATGVTINLSAAAYQNITGAITFRLYGWGASAAGGTWSVNDFTFNGTVTCGGGCTAPTTTITPGTQTVCANVTASITVSSSATTPTYQWQMSANGSTGWVNVANGTPTGVTYSGATTATLSAVGTSSAQYYYQCLVTESGTCTATTNTTSITIISGPAITAQPVSVSTTSTGTASYTVAASGTGLSYQWQENSGSGFSNLSNGGSNPTYAGVTNSVLTVSSPPLSMSGYSYQCIVSNACGTVTTNGTSVLTVTVAAASVCPYFVAAVVNACAGSCSGEGNNEFVVMNSGSYSIPVNGTDLNVVYNNGSDQFFTQSYAPQPGVISNLNSLAGCGTLFVDVSSGTIPPNSTFFIMNQGSCFNNGSFSAYCGVGTIYVAFSTDATWSSAGFFGNNNSTRFFRTNFSTIDAACGSVTYNYNTANEFGFGSDGASVVFNGTTPSYVNGNGDCVPSVTILPISLVDFFATANGDKNDIVWKVAAEEGIRNYIIEKSEDGINFTELARLIPKGSEGNYTTYSTEDLFPNKGITYYRLSTIESDYSYKRYEIIDVDRSSKKWEASVYQNEQDLIVEFKNTIPKNSNVDLFDLTGKVLISKAIDQSHVKINANELATGIYFVRITTAYKTENFKIIIQK